ncbi:MAG: endolytic transglycosylase MltG [Hyphomicrobiaceae bacterium]
MRQSRGYASSTHDNPPGLGLDPVTGRDPRTMPRSPSELLEPSRAPGPPRRRQKSGNRALGRTARVLNGLLTLLLIMMLGIGGLFYFVRVVFDKAGPLSHSTVIVIPRGEGLNAIAERLEREGIIGDSRVFVASVYYFGAAKKLKAGEYEIRKQASMRQVLDTLVEGKSILYKVSVPEGLTSYQVAEILRNEPNLTGEITEVPAEGSLLPDTYRYARNTDRQDLLKRMQSEQERFLEAVWGTRMQGLPFQNLDQAITLASIVEKETGRADERDRIAGVFVNRLRKGMRLQSDPTIIYGVTGGKGSLGRPIRRSEIDAKNAYNTYQIDGLPPSPICNPGRAAIEAVLNPADTKDIYFVADGTGGHAFAETIRDHQNNVKSWRRIEAKMRAEKKLAAAEAQTATVSDAAQEVSAGPGVLTELEGVDVEQGETTAVAANDAGEEAALAPVAATGGTPDPSMPLPERKP